MGAAWTKTKRPPLALTKENVDDFMQQFDTIVSDCDGVLWTPLRGIPHVKEGLESLRAAGKKILFVTNNSVIPPFRKFERLGFAVQKNEVVYPAIAIGRYLEKIGFKKKAFVLGVEHFKDELRSRGVAVVPDKRTSDLMEEDLGAMLRAIHEDTDIGAVIVDLDVNLTFMDLVKATNHLKRPDCMFLVGATDSFVTFDEGKILLGPGHFIRTLEECSGRKAELIGKPGPMMVSEYLQEIHNLNMDRTIFMGDSLVQDMGVANACGMKKLLVLSGMTQLKDLETCDPELLPDYYIDSIGDLPALLGQRGA
ncbi:glycerol-3-phosphate phosphatase-like [Frankliniella occidentalis]|uniref:Glycerol-3-phosphate phosphatase-like n=1 Tax=Frankliniella occidentalis TaxID=133901 RepID=A0A6J1TBR3_FRAOC|nr:glycerol-3-phosphate phosphatase-like [Frankliniella occidentalis]